MRIFRPDKPCTAYSKGQNFLELPSAPKTDELRKRTCRTCEYINGLSYRKQSKSHGSSLNLIRRWITHRTCEYENHVTNLYSTLYSFKTLRKSGDIKIAPASMPNRTCEYAYSTRESAKQHLRESVLAPASLRIEQEVFKGFQVVFKSE
jgi:hypothetical protein